MKLFLINNEDYSISEVEVEPCENPFPNDRVRKNLKYCLFKGKRTVYDYLEFSGSESLKSSREKAEKEVAKHLSRMVFLLETSIDFYKNKIKELEEEIPKYISKAEKNGYTIPPYSEVHKEWCEKQYGKTPAVSN